MLTKLSGPSHLTGSPRSLTYYITLHNVAGKEYAYQGSLYKPETVVPAIKASFQAHGKVSFELMKDLMAEYGHHSFYQLDDRYKPIKGHAPWSREHRGPKLPALMSCHEDDCVLAWSLHNDEVMFVRIKD